jgi:hypothetical protein
VNPDKLTSEKCIKPPTVVITTLYQQQTTLRENRPDYDVVYVDVGQFYGVVSS